MLTDLLSIDRVKVPLEATNKEELLRELVMLATAGHNHQVQEDVLRAVRDREAVLSTGIGYGVAIPHGKSAAIRDLALAAGRARVPVDFDALDGQPVRLFFLLIGPESAAGPHIKALSRISRVVRRDDVREQLFTAADATAFLRALADADA